MKRLALFFCAVSLLSASEAMPTSITQGICRINERDIEYTAEAGTYTLKTADGKPSADIFFIAYTKDGEEKSSRPITFCFNGGPGSSSVWLHMGALGPRRIVVDDLKPTLAPYFYKNNSQSILDVTDLVFIDPVSTGYSHPAKGISPSRFHGVCEDIESVAEFIRLYITRNARWPSPKYLAGESYGSTRAAGLVDYLQDKRYMHFNGVILISSALNFRTFAVSSDGNDLPFQMYLPTYTAIAWYHKKLPYFLQDRSLEEVIDQSKAFALGAYNKALTYGDALCPDEQQAIMQELSNLTGLDLKVIKRFHMRVPPEVFYNNFLKSNKQRIGRMDGRVIGYLTKLPSRLYTDPSTVSIASAFTASFNDYVCKELKWQTDERYGVLENVFPWNFTRYNAYAYPATDKDLARAMQCNPKLRTLIASGYYDLATPFFAAEYVVNHLDLDQALRSNIEMHYYPAGHMMFLHPPSLAALKHHISAFITHQSN